MPTDIFSIALLIVGLLTSSMIIQLCAPQYGLAAFSGKNITDPYVLFLARCAALPVVALGILMIWAAFNEQLQWPIMCIAIISKLVYLALILSHWKETGKAYLSVIIIDSLSVLVLTGCLLTQSSL